MKTLLKISSSIILLSVFITINACDSSTDSSNDQTFRGNVVDQNGNPLSDAKVYWYVAWNQFIQGNSMSSALQKLKNAEHHIQSVHLDSFEGLVTEQGVELTWVTSGETDNMGFILIRNGIEIDSFVKTDFLKGQGTSNSKHVYHYIDRDIVDLEQYKYELKSVNYIGYEELLELHVDLIVDINLQRVQLDSFEGLVTEKGVELTWTTNRETENVGFILVRNGIAISSYEVTDLLKGQGTTNSKHVYNYIDRDIVDLGQYKYELKSVNYIGYEELLELHVDLIVDINPIFPVYDNSLHQNYPNPFDGNTTISFSIKEPGNAKITIYNLRSEVIDEINYELEYLGSYTINYNAWDKKLSNGLYHYEIQFGDYSKKRRMFVNDPDATKLSETEPIAISNTTGNFSIDPDDFGFGLEVGFRDEFNYELGLASVPNTLTLCLIKDGYQTLVREVTIDPEGGQRLDFTMVQK